MIEKAELDIRDIQERLKQEAAKKLLLAGCDVVLGGFLSTAGLIIGAPIMGATGAALGLPSVKKGAEDLHDGLMSIRELIALASSAND